MKQQKEQKSAGALSVPARTSVTISTSAERGELKENVPLAQATMKRRLRFMQVAISVLMLFNQSSKGAGGKVDRVNVIKPWSASDAAKHECSKGATKKQSNEKEMWS